MSIQFSVKLSKIVDRFSLGTVYLPCDPAEILITTIEVNRPGLQLAGFFDFFDNGRIQIFGKSESAYIEALDKESVEKCMFDFFSHKPVATVICRDIPIFPEMIAAAQKYGCHLFSTDSPTSEFMSTLIAMLNVELALRITRHGVLVEVYGEGILIMGESGVGKSETAMELVKRGHRLIADDAVEIRRVSGHTLVGSSPANIRHFMELRGIGIINVRRIFGIGSVKVTQQIDMVIQLEHWDPKKIYDRMGIDNEYIEILGNNITSVTIPVKPGRNLAIIIEVAAMNNRQKVMGYNSAQDLLNKLGMMEGQQEETPGINWD